MGLGDILEAQAVKVNIAKSKEKIRQYKHNERMRNSGKSNKDPNNLLLPLPKKDPGFEAFTRWYSYPMYRGSFDWQLESHNKLWPTKYSLELVHRKAGKSVKYGNEYQWAMQYKNMDILLLGWTDRRKEIAAFIYTFFHQYDLIEHNQRTSPFHFKIKNGGKFDCYLITGKETLGMHSVGKQERFIDLSEAEREELRDLLILYDENKILTDGELDDFIKDREGSERKLWIAIDDPIDITFRKERYREKDLELRFDSTLYSIDPDKWSFTGTHKFEGDIFDFWMDKFKDELVTFISGPIREDGSILTPELYTHPSIPTYKKDLEDGKQCLAKIRKHIGEYAWHSEWCQKPHPITGEVWDKVYFENIMKEWPQYDILLVSLDRATTQNPKSSFTGYTVTLREKKGPRLTINDFTRQWVFEDLLYHVNEFIIDFHSIYVNILIFLVIEKQGGGDDFESSIQSRPKFYSKELDKWSDNKILDYATIVMIHNSSTEGNKKERIKTYLFAPINSGRHRFLRNLEHSELVEREILPFPNPARLDGVDALANAEKAMMVSDKIPKQGEADVDSLDETLFYLQREHLREKGQLYDDNMLFGIVKDDGGGF